MAGSGSSPGARSRKRCGGESWRLTEEGSMRIRYDDIVPWGRSYEEYVRMFNLSESDLARKILGCGDGPASFNSGMFASGKKVVSIDPIYRFSKEQIKNKIDERYDEIVRKTEAHRDKFIWTTFRNVQELAESRMRAMNDFLSDYETGLNEKRYIYGALPDLPFENDEFDLVLSSHLLFFYSENLDFDFHIRSITEMLRLAREVRIFPIVDLNAEVSEHFETVCRYFSEKNIRIEETKVEYEFQKGGNLMVKFTRSGHLLA
jgi:hypothetical protein